MYHHKPHELTNDFYVRVYISFDDWKYIPREKFEWIEEWHADADTKIFDRRDSFEELKNGNWWKENNTSLILTPEPIIEDIELRRIKKKSLELAGVGS